MNLCFRVIKPWKQATRLMLLIVLQLSFQSSYSSEQVTDINDKLKSAMVYKLAKFVRWPASDGSPAGNFHICLLNNGLISSDFNALEKHRLQQLPISVSAFKRSDMVDDSCQLVFIEKDKAPFLEDILSTLRSKGPVLTVSDYYNFAEQGGMVELGVEQRKLSVKVNLDNVTKAKLKISAVLLQLSTVISRQEVSE